MTTQEKIESIRQVCIKANPDKFGQLLNPHVIRDKEREYCGERACGDCFCMDQNEHVHNNNVVSLADVLLAIISKDSANRTRIVLESSGQFRDNVEHLLGPNWNFHNDNLIKQSPECIDFLYDLLK